LEHQNRLGEDKESLGPSFRWLLIKWR